MRDGLALAVNLLANRRAPLEIRAAQRRLAPAVLKRLRDRHHPTATR